MHEKNFDLIFPSVETVSGALWRKVRVKCQFFSFKLFIMKPSFYSSWHLNLKKHWDKNGEILYTY